MPSVRDILVRQNAYQDSLLYTFESHLREIVMRAQGRTMAILQQRLKITDGVIDSTPGNLMQLRAANKIFLAELEEAGYSRLVEAFVGEFRGSLQFLDETVAFLGDQVDQKWRVEFTARDRNLLAGMQGNTVWAIEETMQAVSGAAITRGLFGVAGLRFSSLVDLLSEKLETSIARARTIADTSMSTFYRTAAARAFQAIEADLPEQELKYRYSGPVDKLERPFCRHLTDVDKGYTREAIDKMSNGQLPNVWLTGGGWNCRHQWILDTRDLETSPSTAQSPALAMPQR